MLTTDWCGSWTSRQTSTGRTWRPLSFGNGSNRSGRRPSPGATHLHLVPRPSTAPSGPDRVFQPTNVSRPIREIATFLATRDPPSTA